MAGPSREGKSVSGWLGRLDQALRAESPTLAQRLVRCLAFSSSWIVRCATACRRLAYQYGLKSSYKVDVPVVSIGNLSVGGTGKSPAVAWFARQLRDRGVRVAILSRGYGQLASGQNDEALELELRLPDVPHLQHPDRVQSARTAIEELQMQALLLDDGFQHLRLRRDYDVVLIDASMPDSLESLLPAGRLREPFASLRRASAVILTRVDQVDAARLARVERKIQRVAANIPIAHARHAPTCLRTADQHARGLEGLTGERILAFCGIGNPDSFFDSLKAQGAILEACKTWPDHHGYSAGDIAELQAWTEQHSDATSVVCTMKDWVKIQLPEIGKTPLLALDIELEIINGRESLLQIVEAVVQLAANNDSSHAS